MESLESWIVTEGEGRAFKCALHFCVADGAGLNLFAASFVGFPSAAWAVSAALKARRRVCIRTEKGEMFLYPCGSLWHMGRRAGARLVHCLVLPRPAALLDGEGARSGAVVLSWDGDWERAVGEYLAARFDLPWEEEWLCRYHELFDVEQLVVVRGVDVAPIPRGAVEVSLPGGLTQAAVDAAVGGALRSGRLRIPRSAVRGVYREGMDLQEYLRANARVFATQVARTAPMHDPGSADGIDPAVVMARVPFPAQAHAVQAIVKAFRKRRDVVCSADMGTGKTIIALGVSAVMHRAKGSGLRVLVTCPGTVVPKWCGHEIPVTLPDAEVLKIGSAEEAWRWRKNPQPFGRVRVLTAEEYLNRFRSEPEAGGIRFVVVGIDRAKLGPQAWWVSALWKRGAGGRGKGWYCPDCNARLTREVGGEEVDVSWWDFVSRQETRSPEEIFTAAGLPRRGVSVRWVRRPPVRKCRRCGASLLRPALKSRGETNLAPRWYAALTLRKLRRHFDLYVADEVHQSKAENTGRGFAFAQLCAAARRVLCLTGTLVNGMSSSVKEILWRLDPRSLIDEGFGPRTGAVEWAFRYGVVERVLEAETDELGIVTRRKRHQDAQPREKPGVSPVLVARHLLHRGVFLELPDIGLPLTKLVERPVVVRLDDHHLEAYRAFHEGMREACVAAVREGEKGAFARFIPSVINAVDRADAEWQVEFGSGGVVRFPGLGPGYLTAKERELVRLVRENLAGGRGVVVYCFYTDRYAVHRRVRDVLLRHGIEAVVLESRVPQEERMAWLEGQARRGARVVVANMRLVECGLDLLPWPTFIFYQMNYDVNTLRQASRRAWRIGQTRECRVYYLVADGTQQVAQMEVCLEKRAHAMLAEGRLDRAEMSRYTRGTRMSLAADIAECIAADDAGARWAGLAAKDVDEVETVDEGVFRAAVGEARRRLVSETLRLCGAAESRRAAAEQLSLFSCLYADYADAPPRPRRRRRRAEAPRWRQAGMFGASAPAG